MAAMKSTQYVQDGERSERSNAANECSQERFRCIAVAAYFKAEARGFAPGRDVDDWLEAEKEYGALSAKAVASEPEAPALAKAA